MTQETEKQQAERFIRQRNDQGIDFIIESLERKSREEGGLSELNAFKLDIAIDEKYAREDREEQRKIDEMANDAAFKVKLKYHPGLYAHYDGFKCIDFTLNGESILDVHVGKLIVIVSHKGRNLVDTTSDIIEMDDYYTAYLNREGR